MSFASAVNKKAIEIGKLSVEMTTAAGSGHPSTALSLAHLVTVLMYHQMRWDPKNPWNGASDRLVLSEGHAVPIVYAAYADLGGMLTPPGKEHDPAAGRPMTRDDAMTLRAINSPIDGHPHPQVGVPFFDAATGSLGQGLSVAAGLGAAARMDGLDRNFYCIIGDGESREGQIWEAADFISDHALTNVVPIFNCNELAQSDWVSPQQSYQGIAEKCKAYGFIVRVIDGHNPIDINEAFRELNVVKNGNRPMAIVARTIKGWGAIDEQGTGKHGTPVKKDHLAEVLGELDQTAMDIGASASKSNGELKISPPKQTIGEGEVKSLLDQLRGATDLSQKKNIRRKLRAAGHYGGLRGDSSRSTADRADDVIKIASFADGLAAVGLDKDLAAGKPIAPRKAYGAALVALGTADERIVGLDADVKNSTHAEWFAKKFSAQYLECKIAEQNMISVAAGVSAAGKIPFCSTFAKFVVRAYDQVEMAIISGANLKITGTHAGVTLASDGPSQMSLPDVAFFRSFCHTTNFNGRPAVSYFFPADAVSCYKITELMANLDGACYQRALRADVKVLYKPEETFEVGGYKVLREGKDMVFVTAGYMVHECLKAADELAKAGKKATVIDAYSMPLQTKGILEIAQKNGGNIMTVEDNYSGGLDAEIAVAIAQSGAGVKLKSLYVHQIPKSGREPQDVLDYLGLGAKQIVAAV